MKNRKIVLGVASVWDDRKGLDDFIQLSEMLDSGYQIVLVGLTEKQIAEAVGVDPSTVSRCLKERVIARPSRRGGVVALRSLSTVGAVKTSAGELISNNAVKVRIRALIEGENKARPRSDQALTDQLNKEGVAVARRTVRKYREVLGYANSTARRQI